jgi:hypothetical protein
MVILLDPYLVDEHKLADDGADLERQLVMEIWDIADDQVGSVDSQSIALFEESTDVVVMIDQFDQHGRTSLL